MSPQLSGCGTKSQDLVISFFLGEEETLPQFHIRALQIRGKIFLLKDKTGQINLTGKYMSDPNLVFPYNSLILNS